MFALKTIMHIHSTRKLDTSLIIPELALRNYKANFIVNTFNDKVPVPYFDVFFPVFDLCNWSDSRGI